MDNYIASVILWFVLIVEAQVLPITARWSSQRSQFYDFKVQITRVTKLCNTKDIVTVNGLYPGPVLFAKEDDRVVVKVTNESPYNITIHWYV